MANTEFNVRIQLKRDTDANWRAKDPKLLAGEMVFVDTNAGEVRTKVGDGTKKYSALPFTDEVLRNLVSDSSKPAFYFEGTTGVNLSFIPTSTVADLNTAYEAGRPCFCSFPVNADGLTATVILSLKAFNKDTTYLFSGLAYSNNSPMWAAVWSADGGISWRYFINALADADNIPVNVSQLANDANYLTSNSANSTYVKKTGDELIKGIKTFESSIVCSMTPGNENHLVNKKYVDSKVGTYLPLSGGAMTGNNSTISNIGQLEFKYNDADKRVILTANEDTFEIKGALEIMDATVPTMAILKAAGNGLIYTDNVIEPIDDNQYVQKAYVDTKANVLLKTWTSTDVS